MRKIFAILTFMLGATCYLPAQSISVSIDDKLPGSVTVVSDTTDTYDAQADSVIQAEVSKRMNEMMIKVKEMSDFSGEDFFDDISGLLAISGMLLLFCLPVLILAVILYYRYKSKKAKYEVMKQALESGKELPPELAPSPLDSEGKSGKDYLWRKGIKNFFLGLGLALFLAILTESELFSIGLLIMCIGAGQIVLSLYPTPSHTKKMFRGKKKESSEEAEDKPENHDERQQSEVNTDEEEIKAPAPEESASSETNKEETKE